MRRRLKLEELKCLYEVLDDEERDELLQALLVAASRGEGAMTRVLEDLILCRSTEELFKRGLPESTH